MKIKLQVSQYRGINGGHFIIQAFSYQTTY